MELDLLKGIPNMLAQSGIEFNLVPQWFIKVHSVLEPPLSFVPEHFFAYKVEINRLSHDEINVILNELFGGVFLTVVMSYIYELK